MLLLKKNLKKHMIYHFTLLYPHQKPASVGDLLRQLLVPRKWRHYLRIEHQILINGRYRYFNQLVEPGDKISLTLSHVQSRQGVYPASGHLPRVIYEDENLLVIDKPAGQKTHPNQGENGTALNDCATYLGFSPYIVHRLDMLTRGLLLVAKNPAVVPILNRQLTTKTLRRDYLAEVSLNHPLPAKGTIDKPIGRDPFDQRKRMVDPQGLKAITHYQVLQKNKEKHTALLKISLETGRTHQIRVHLASIACPIIGDPLYNSAFQKGQALKLTAYKLTFIKPFSFSQQEVRLFQSSKR